MGTMCHEDVVFRRALSVEERDGAHSASFHLLTAEALFDAYVNDPGKNDVIFAVAACFVSLKWALSQLTVRMKTSRATSLDSMSRIDASMTTMIRVVGELLLDVGTWEEVENRLHALLVHYGVSRSLVEEVFRCHRQLLQRPHELGTPLEAARMSNDDDMKAVSSEKERLDEEVAEESLQEQADQLERDVEREESYRHFLVDRRDGEDPGGEILERVRHAIEDVEADVGRMREEAERLKRRLLEQQRKYRDLISREAHHRYNRDTIDVCLQELQDIESRCLNLLLPFINKMIPHMDTMYASIMGIRDLAAGQQQQQQQHAMTQGVADQLRRYASQILDAALALRFLAVVYGAHCEQLAQLREALGGAVGGDVQKTRQVRRMVEEANVRGGGGFSESAVHAAIATIGASIDQAQPNGNDATAAAALVAAAEDAAAVAVAASGAEAVNNSAPAVTADNATTTGDDDSAVASAASISGNAAVVDR